VYQQPRSDQQQRLVSTGTRCISTGYLSIYDQLFPLRLQALLTPQTDTRHPLLHSAKLPIYADPLIHPAVARLIPKLLTLRNHLPRRPLVVIVSITRRPRSRQATSANAAVGAGGLAIPCLVRPAEDSDTSSQPL
jgi:hypothetical protein